MIVIDGDRLTNRAVCYATKSRDGPIAVFDVSSNNTRGIATPKPILGQQGTREGRAI